MKTKLLSLLTFFCIFMLSSFASADIADLSPDQMPPLGNNLETAAKLEIGKYYYYPSHHNYTSSYGQFTPSESGEYVIYICCLDDGMELDFFDEYGSKINNMHVSFGSMNRKSELKKTYSLVAKKHIDSS